MTKINHVTTNIRVPKQSMTLYKSLSAEINLSFNEFANRALAFVAKNPNFYQRVAKDFNRQDDAIWKLPSLARAFKKDVSGASEIDQIVYQLNE